VETRIQKQQGRIAACDASRPEKRKGRNRSALVPEREAGRVGARNRLRHKQQHVRNCVASERVEHGHEKRVSEVLAGETFDFLMMSMTKFSSDNLTLKYQMNRPSFLNFQLIITKRISTINAAVRRILNNSQTVRIACSFEIPNQTKTK